MSTLIQKNIFREYDIRGIYNKEVNQELAWRLGRAFVTLIIHKTGIKNPQIAIGMDCRLSGPDLRDALQLGIHSKLGASTTLGVCPTPLSYFSNYTIKVDASIMITGSHNPSEYNGFKMVIQKGSVYGQEIQKLFQLIQEDHQPFPGITTSNKNEKTDYNVHDDYIKWMKEKFTPLNRKIKVVVDAGNGVAGNLAPDIYRNMGCEVIELYCELDGRFPNHHPDPTVPKNLAQLVSTVQQSGADIGIGFDGDADRIGIVDNNGKIIYGDQLLYLLAADVLSKNPNCTIISEVKSSSSVYEAIRKLGGNAIMWKTGHSLIKAKMKETGAMLAGEMSGHIFFADDFFGYDDAIYAGARCLLLLDQSKKSISELLSALPELCNTPEIRIDCSDETKFEVVEKVKLQLSNEFQIIDVDGVRIETDFGWGLLRASNTQPVLVMRFEGRNQSDIKKLQEIIESALFLTMKQMGLTNNMPR